MTRCGVFRLACVLAGATLAIATSAACAREPVRTEPLHEVYSPVISRVPPGAPYSEAARRLERDWRAGGRDTIRDDLFGFQGLTLAVSLGVILLAGMNYRHRRDPANLDLLLLWAIGASFFDVMRFFGVLRQPEYLTLLDTVFITVVVLSLAVLLRAVVRVLRPARYPWHIPAGSAATAVLAVTLVASDVYLALARAPDDAGFFVNLGAQRLRERGQLPYGDPLLTGTPGAAYAPLLYAAHVPFQILASPEPINRDSPARPRLGPDSSYYLPPPAATQWCTAAFHIVGVAALWIAVRRMSGVTSAWAAVALYAGSIAVLGIGGPGDQVAGITFASHIAPATTTLMAFAALPWPALSGVLLVAAAGVGFYPAFLFPAWLGHYWNDRAHRMRFLIGTGIMAVLLASAVLALSRPAAGRSLVGTVAYDTFGHHTESSGYGSSPFGVWGQRGGVRGALMRPIVGSSGLTSPVWLVYFGLMGWSFFLARGRTPRELALLAGALAVSATLVKPHATGSYMAWYYGLLLAGVMGGRFTSGPQNA